MAEPQYQLVDNGQEVQQADLDLLGQVSGLADDRLLAELLRLTPFDGTNTYKAIIPFAQKLPRITGPTAFSKFTVSASGSSNGSITISPFRAVVGSRTAVGTSSLSNWRDIRSTIYVGSSTTLTNTVALAPNSSGNPRWDLVYAIVSIDQPSATVTRKVKDPSSGAVTTQNVSVTLVQTVTVAITTGTPGATPAIPTIPADGGGIYNIPLAVIGVPNGFSGVSTVSPQQIRDYVNVPAGLSRIGEFSHTTGTIRARPANGNNDGEGTYITNQPWTAGSLAPPICFIPPSMVGAEIVFIEIMAVTGGAFSHPPNSVVDSSMDWRNRFTVAFTNCGNGALFGNASSLAGSTYGLPAISTLITGGTGTLTQISNTMGGASNSQVVWLDPTTSGGILPGGTAMSLKVDSNGRLIVTYTGTPGCSVFCAILVSSQWPNLY